MFKRKKKIYPIVLIKSEKVFNVTTCSICLDKLTEINCSVLPCGHKYHFDCIYSWLEKDNSCPNCRIKLKFVKR